MSSNPNIEQNETMDVQTAQRVEQEKMTRRAALRKLGFGAGIAAFSMFGVDDFARMVGRRMERMVGDNKVALAVAKEFQGAGMAFAAGPSGTCGCITNCKPGPYQYCEGCAWPCTGSVLRNENCGDFKSDYAKCQACCHYRNPDHPSTTLNIGYNYCVSTAGCA